jgi:ribosomal protein S18 acetylase RimI-like enzyme
VPFRCPEGFAIERFDEKRHERSLFDCGEPELNRYLKDQSRQDETKGASRTHVMVEVPRQEPGLTETASETIKLRIVGYCTIANASIMRSSLPTETSRKLAKYPSVPAGMIARLACDKDYQGRRLGEALLFYALDVLNRLSAEVGCAIVIVDAKHEMASKFYRRYGFRPLHLPRLNSLVEAVRIFFRLTVPEIQYPERLYLRPPKDVK